MIFQIFILVIHYLVEASEPSLNGLTNVQNSLATEPNVLSIIEYNSNMMISRQKRQVGSSRVQIKHEKSKSSKDKSNSTQIRFKVARNSRGKKIQCEDDQQCQLSLDGVGECIRGRCIVQFCRLDKHCPDNHKCHDQFCIILGKCRMDDDCGPGFDCEDGFCMPAETDGECKEDKDCPYEVFFHLSILKYLLCILLLPLVNKLFPLIVG